jgi:hypothetical protein
MSDAAIFGQMPSESGWRLLMQRGKTPEQAEKIAAQQACTGRVGRVLADLAGDDISTWNIPRFNLNARWRPKFDKTEAAVTASTILTQYPEIKRVVCLGRCVGAIMGFGKNARLLRARKFNDRSYLLFPHPSGRNHWFNEPENVKQASETLRKFLRLR